MADWKPKVERRQHPFGEAGVNSSLQEVAKKAAEGSLDPRVRAWAIECLERARREKGLKVNTERERAEILLKAVQAKLWVPDPVGSEWMAGSHLMTCTDKDAPCFHGGDCDDLSAMLGACFLTVGLHTMIVGHGYNAQRQIGHVLCAVRVAGRWLYADPSTDLPLGECVKFTREQLLSTPNVKVLCDQNKCLTFPTLFDPNKNGFVDKGEFVGVNGPDGEPILQWIEGPGEVMQWLGAQEQSAEDKTYDELLKEAEKRDYGTSRADFEAYGAVAGGTAATAVCAATGAGVAITPFCAVIGAGIGKALGGQLYNWGEKVFNPDAEEWRKYQERREYTRALFATQEAVWAMRVQMNEDLILAATDVMILRKNLRPEITWTVTNGIVELGQNGLELTRLPKTLMLYPPNIVEKWDGLMGRGLTLEQATDAVAADVAYWYGQLKKVSIKTTLQITAGAAVDDAAEEIGEKLHINPALLKLVPPPQPVVTKKSSGVGKVLVGTAVIGALGYAAFTVFA